MQEVPTCPYCGTPDNDVEFWLKARLWTDEDASHGVFCVNCGQRYHVHRVLTIQYTVIPDKKGIFVKRREKNAHEHLKLVT